MSPLSPTVVGKDLFYPGHTSDEVVLLVSGVTTDDRWHTRAYLEGKWVEIDPYPDVPAIAYAGAIGNGYRRVKEENKFLKQQLSQERLEKTLEEHAHIRTKRKLEQLRGESWGWTVPTTVKLFLFFFLLSFLVGRGMAETTTRSTKPKREPLLEQFWNNVTEEVNRFWILLDDSKLPTWVEDTIIFSRTYGFWMVSVGSLAIWMMSDEHGLARTIPSVLVLIASIITRFRWSALAALPYQTPLSCWVLVMATLVAYRSVVASLVVLTAGVFLTPLFCLMASDIQLYRTFMGMCMSALMLVCSFCMQAVGYDPSLAGLAFAFFRVYALFVQSAGDRVEVKLGSKVIASMPYRGFYQGAIRRLKQLRVGAQPLMHVQTGAVCTIVNGDTIGTGFFCGNNIITAAHVAAGPGTSAIYEGKRWDITFEKELQGRDIAIFSIPTGLNKSGLPRLKVSKHHQSAEWCTVMAPDNGAYIVSTTACFMSGDRLSYTTPTRNGMSGAPVCDQHGKVLGVHNSNTGYTGAANALYASDLLPRSAKDDEIESLRAQLAALKRDQENQNNTVVEMKQCLPEGDIVDLVRCAVGSEIGILRAELARDLGLEGPALSGAFEEKKKGKNKPHKAAGKKKPNRKIQWFTEEEYEQLQEESGGDQRRLMELAAEIIRKRWNAHLDGTQYYDDDDEDDMETGYYGRGHAASRGMTGESYGQSDTKTTIAIQTDDVGNHWTSASIQPMDQRTQQKSKNPNGPRASGGKKNADLATGQSLSKKEKENSSRSPSPSSGKSRSTENSGKMKDQGTDM
nr:ORF1a [Coypu astrovirus 2]